jgi:hypothetical protein
VDLLNVCTLSVGSDEIWEIATNALIDALKAKGLSYKLDEGGGAFYGPKIDLKIRDAIGRLWQCSTIQCDFNLPERFDLQYVSDEVCRNFELVQSSIFSGYQNKMDCFLILGGSKASYHGSSCNFWFHGKVLWCSIGEHRRKPSIVASARAIKTITSHRQCGAILSGGGLMRTSIIVHFHMSFSTHKPSLFAHVHRK